MISVSIGYFFQVFSLTIYSVYLLAVLGLRCFVQAFSSYRKWGLLSLQHVGLVTVALTGPRVQARESRHMGSVAPRHVESS